MHIILINIFCISYETIVLPNVFNIIVYKGENKRISYFLMLYRNTSRVFTEMEKNYIISKKEKRVGMLAKRIIKLSYKVQNKFEAEFIAGYFRFMGVMVAQEIYHDDAIQKEDSPAV